ncbi:hypothetical protein HPB52_000163 [Rhipicephalus sanguineus]|uniref:Uncharacterized protein n=1 Tax=Rhipicephalus sanguineus TaxID=34632 RepID=A0A9D4PDN4_RHISA|nr:hypothetical protein HPB52_000163 [Rhipicephalus sanguineus]
MRRRKQPDPGGTAASSKFRPRTEPRSQSADGVEADRGSKAATPVTRSLDPSRRRVADEAARSTDSSTRQAASGLATEDHTLEASPSRQTVSPGGRGAVDDVPSAADACQLLTVAPTVAETRLSTRSKSSMLGGEADTAPPVSVRRSSRGKKKRRHRGSAKSNTGAEREPTESAATEAPLKSQRRSSVDETPSHAFQYPEASAIGNFAAVIHDLVAKADALYIGVDATTAGASIDAASTECHRGPSSKLVPANSVGPADNTSADAPKSNGDTVSSAPSTSRNQRVVQPSVQAGADAVVIEDGDTAVLPPDQKQARTVARVPTIQKSSSSSRKDKGADSAEQRKPPLPTEGSGSQRRSQIPKQEPVQQGPAAPAVTSAPAPMRQQFEQGRPSTRAPKPRTQGTHKKDSDSSRLLSRGSEDPGGSSHDARKSAVGSSGQWSFYPLNVSFVTEMDSQRERLLYGAAICAVALLGSILMGAVIAAFYASRVPSPLACVTAECVAAREYLSGLLNTSRDACSDFYGYVCSSWIVQGQNGGSFRADSIGTALVKINNYLSRREDAADDPTDLRLMRRIYQKCHRYATDARVRSFAASLEAARKQLNWAAIRGVRTYHGLVVLLVRTSLLLGFHTVLAIQLLSDDRRVFLRLSCGRSLFQKLTTTDKRWDLEATLRIVNDDADELARILEIDEGVNAHLGGCAGNDELSDVTVDLDEILDDLVSRVSATDWVSAVSAVLMDSGVDRSHLLDVGLASGATGFRDAFRDVTNSSGGVEAAGTYLATHLDAEVLSIELSRSRLPPNPEGTALFCLVLARKPVVFSWPRLLARILELRGSKKALQTMFGYLRETTPKTTVFTWLAKAMPRVAEKRIQKVELAVVSDDMAPMAARATQEEDSTWKLADDFDQHNASFVEVFIQAMALVHGRLVRNPPTMQAFIVSRLEQRNELGYSEAISSVVVPTLYQRVPHFYAVDVPPYFNYATVGALMATRIAEVVGPAYAAAKESEGHGRQRPDVWWTRAAKRQYNATAQCLERLHGRLGLRHRAADGGTTALKRRDMVLRVQGLRLAYDALVESFGPATNGKEFVRLWPEAQATFFVRFCLLSCDADQRDPKPVLSPRAKCLLPLHNMPEFGSVFDCGEREDFVAEQCLP